MLSVFGSVIKTFTLTTAKNSQNDLLYPSSATKNKDFGAKRLLRTRKTFSQSLTVTDGVSKLGYIGLIFVNLGLKFDGTYYCAVAACRTSGLWRVHISARQCPSMLIVRH